MFMLWGTIAGVLLYLEIVYHMSGFGFSEWNPVYTIALIAAWSGIATLLVGILKGRLKKISYYICLWLPTIWVCIQFVYLSIFKQPLLWEAMFRGGGDALTNYYKEALAGVIAALPFLVLMLLPAVIIGIMLHWKKWEFPEFQLLQYLRTVVVIIMGIVCEIVIMSVGGLLEADFHEEYTEFYDPLSVAEGMGFLPMLQRDTLAGPMQLIETFIGEQEEAMYAQNDTATAVADTDENTSDGSDDLDADENTEASENATENKERSDASEESSVEWGDETGEDSSVEEDCQEETMVTEEPVSKPQQFHVDYAKLHELADNKHQTWLADYIEGQIPTNTNEYTGFFEGYNLIFLTAEGFSTYAIREDLTPTLHRMVNSGFVFENYYVPLWQTSTSDGEYINCTGLIPNGQFSMRESGDNDMAYTLAKYFTSDGVNAYAYHNNSLSYYDRYITHPNLGYDFKSSKLGNLSEEEWGNQLFAMENPNAWPASDLEMMQGTIAEYMEQERFHVYYLTVSGHMNYNFKGNAMSYKNRDAVAGLELSENARAYLACNIELDKALEYLLEQLETAGQLDKTVICLSADHYPYSMSAEQYEELAGKSLAEGMDLYRNSLILWNAGMEEEPVYVEKACGPMDLLPTLLNLFGFEYDSRMYAGRDIFSDTEGLVIFKDRSFVTDSVIYVKKGKSAIWLQDAEGNDMIADEYKETYLSNLQQEVKDRYQFSAYVLQEDYYRDLKQAVIAESE
uniref:sulfatase-like hydrolase/transferase n=1 Tax=Acetatifactor sp. TaxID=1872090 RepID=UPI004055AE7A